MSRAQRIDFPGAVHHVFNRGARRAAVFEDDYDRRVFLTVLAGLGRRHSCRVLAWCLMGNHYHLALRSDRGDLPSAMQHLIGTYVRRFNERHGYDGPLFRGRYCSRLVDDDRYLQELVLYLHLNPVEAHLVAHPDAYRWSSHRAMSGLMVSPSWLHLSPALEVFGSTDQYRQHCAEVLSGRRLLDPAIGQAAVAAPSPTTIRPTAPSVDPRLAIELGLRQLAEVTGCSPAELCRSRRQRPSHPGRRLAAWWLLATTGASRAVVGDALGISASSVGAAASRARHTDDPVVREWMRELTQRYISTAEQARQVSPVATATL